MRCSCCNKPMHQAAVTVRKAWETASGLSGVEVLVYGPKCAQRLNLMPSVQPSVKTQHRPVKRAGRIIKNYLVAISDGQVELFEELTTA